jgi:hypothetical protein
VVFGKWSGAEVKIGGVEYLIMKESDILGVLTEAEARRKAAWRAGCAQNGSGIIPAVLVTRASAAD